MIVPQHHAPDELLCAYAAGGLDEGLSLLVASHIALDPASRSRVAAYEAVGGALLQSVAPAPLDDDALARVLDRLDENDPQARQAAVAAPPRDGLALPAPLRLYVGPDIEALAWQDLMRHVDIAVLPVAGAFDLWLLRIASGQRVPRHRHEGLEILLVLDGACEDEGVRFARGDVQVNAVHSQHAPLAVAGAPCLCLAAFTAPITVLDAAS